MLLGLFGLNARPKSSEPQYSYQARKRLLSAAELSFYQVLARLAGTRFAVCSKVRLADVFSVSGREGTQAARNRINQKHIDFLLCDPRTMAPILGIELDDSSHQRADRVQRDDFVDEIFRVADVPLLRVRAQKSYNTEERVELIKKNLRSNGSAAQRGPSAR
jgi:hypothetical protein